MICAECRERVMFGWRNGEPGWLHRTDKDHPGVPIVEPPEPEPLPEIPEPEVRRTDVGPRDERVPGGVRTITNLLAKQGWELRRLTYARGPYVGAKGDVLSISDSIVLGARGPEVDGRRRFAVASWRDGKFDSAWILEGNSKGAEVVGPANATELKNWIKGTT